MTQEMRASVTAACTQCCRPTGTASGAGGRLPRFFINGETTGQSSHLRHWMCTPSGRRSSRSAPPPSKLGVRPNTHLITDRQICTGAVPFPKLPERPTTVSRVVRDGLPRQAQPVTIEDELWRIVKACCGNDELRRPTMAVVTGWIRDYAV